MKFSEWLKEGKDKKVLDMYKKLEDDYEFEQIIRQIQDETKLDYNTIEKILNKAGFHEEE